LNLEGGMPGFMIDRFGGERIHTQPLGGKRQYYYNYFWEIEDLFETKLFSTTDALISLKDVTLPTFTVSKETYVGSTLEYKFAKNVTWEDIKVSWYDSEGLLPFVKGWRESVWTPNTGLQMSNEYKKISIIHHFLPTGKRNNKWRLINSWPSQIRNGELTYTSSEIKLVEVTITYDWAEETPG